MVQQALRNPKLKTSSDIQKELLELIDKTPYDEFNMLLKVIKGYLNKTQIGLFDTTLTEQLPNNTARIAYRLAVKSAFAASSPVKPQKQKFVKKTKKKVNKTAATR